MSEEKTSAMIVDNLPVMRQGLAMSVDANADMTLEGVSRKNL